jgi:hypothetical protein
VTTQLPFAADQGHDLGREPVPGALPVRPSDRHARPGQAPAGLSDAALDQLLSMHDAPALPAGLAARIMRDVPLLPQLAAPSVQASTPTFGPTFGPTFSPTFAPALRSAAPRGQVIPLRVVGGTDHGGRRPMRARLSAWRGAMLMLGGTGIGALAASVAAVALFGLPFQNTPQGATGASGAVPSALVASAAATGRAPVQPGANPALVPVAPAAGGPVQAGGVQAGGIQNGGALAANAPPVVATPLGAAASDTSDPDPVLPPAAPDRQKLAAQSPDPGPDQPGQMGPSLGTAHGAMGPFLPQQGYGFSGGGMGQGTMGNGTPIPGVMQSMGGQPMAGHGPSLP